MSDINREARFELKRLSANIQQHTDAIEQAVDSGVQPKGKDIKVYLHELKSATKLIEGVRKQLDESVLGTLNLYDIEE